MKNNKYTLSVIAAGSLWGLMGFFRRSLEEMGISALGCLSVRCTCAALLFALAMLAVDRKAFKIKLKDSWIFLGSGGLSLFVFGACYFKAMDYMSLSAAAILLYTAPCFVMLMSALLFKEKITGRKLIAMAIAFAGICLVSGIGTGGGSIKPIGIVFGLGSGICYALYSIFSRFALNRGYSAFTINFYSSLIGALFAMIIGGFDFVPCIFASGRNVLFGVGTGFITCFLPYFFYTTGLKGLENGKASIIASIEPVVATIVGALVYHEKLTLMGGAGIVLVLSAIVLLNLKEKKKTALV